MDSSLLNNSIFYRQVVDAYRISIKKRVRLRKFEFEIQMNQFPTTITWLGYSYHLFRTIKTCVATPTDSMNNHFHSLHTEEFRYEIQE